MPEAIASAIDVDGWLHTGDLGTMDERGYCMIQGRPKDMIIRGGENIYPPRDRSCPVRASGGVRRRGRRGARRTMGRASRSVRLAEGVSSTPAELSAHVRDRSAAYKAPWTWVFVDAFPLTGSGKIQKFMLRNQYVKGELDPS
jgi:fatty-acyl-CoA synthase